MCNVNQVLASFLRYLDASGDVLTNSLTNVFLNGQAEDLTEEEQLIIDDIKYQLDFDEGYSFSDWSRQSCNELFISITKIYQ